MDFSERELRAFAAVVLTGSLGRAAQLVNLAQPSVSRLVQRMELGLGQPLFERTTRGMVPTAAGEVLLIHSRQVLADLETLREELDALRGFRRGIVRIGAVASVMRTLVAQAAAQVLSAHPDLRVEAREGVNSELLEALNRREIDLVVAWGKLSDETVTCLGRCDFTDNFGVFCAAGNPLASEPDPTELFKCRWVMPAADLSPRALFEDIARRMGHIVDVSIETSSVETMIAMASATNLLCWLPIPLAADRVKQGALRQIRVPALELGRTFLVYQRRRGILPDAAKAFLRFLPLIPTETALL